MTKYYTNKILVDMLEKLSIEQIMEIKEELKEKISESEHFQYLCDVAIGKINERQRREIFAEFIRKKNAPSSATNTEQGNVTD